MFLVFVRGGYHRTTRIVEKVSGYSITETKQLLHPKNRNIIKYPEMLTVLMLCDIMPEKCNSSY